MIVHNLDFLGVTVAPHETNTPLVVNANAVLALAVSLQSLELIAWINGQYFKARGGVQNLQFVECPLLNTPRESA